MANKLRNPLGQRLTRAQAIRAKCLNCCCFQQTEVRNCVVEKCPLWPYRMGHGEDRADDSLSAELSVNPVQDALAENAEVSHA